EVAGGQQSEAWVGVVLFLRDVADVGELAPAEVAVLVQRHVFAGEHELGGHAVRAGADVQGAQVGGGAVGARGEDELVGPGGDLGAGTADHEQGVLAGAGQVGDAELAAAVPDPAGPAGKDVAPAVLRHRLLEGRVGDQVVLGAGEPGRGRQEGQG